MRPPPGAHFSAFWCYQLTVEATAQGVWAWPEGPERQLHPQSPSPTPSFSGTLLLRGREPLYSQGPPAGFIGEVPLRGLRARPRTPRRSLSCTHSLTYSGPGWSTHHPAALPEAGSRLHSPQGRRGADARCPSDCSYHNTATSGPARGGGSSDPHCCCEPGGETEATAGSHPTRAHPACWPLPPELRISLSVQGRTVTLHQASQDALRLWGAQLLPLALGSQPPCTLLQPPGNY